MCVSLTNKIKNQPVYLEDSVRLGHILALLRATLSRLDNGVEHRHPDMAKTRPGMNTVFLTRAFILEKN